ncbi:MAG: hypothetical protein AAGD01_04035 [Acidobacteriota bacterium]
MTESPIAAAPSPPVAVDASSSPLWRRQLSGVWRMEVKKNLLSLRIVPTLLLAALPVGLVTLLAVLHIFFGEGNEGSGAAVNVYSYIYRFYFLKVAIFFGTLTVFLHLFRSDLLERSLHYYMLCPIPRHLLVLGKYLAGLLATSVLLVSATAVTFLVVFGVFGEGLPLGDLLAYCGVTLMGCLGYGALFMLSGLYFRSPVVPPLALYLWEVLIAFLPPVLKRFSVIHYLISLLPVNPVTGVFEVLSEPTPTYFAIPGLLILAAAALALAVLKAKKLEVTYSDD